MNTLKNAFTLLLFALSSLLSAQQLQGDLKFWEKQDFLGFDEIGDCIAETGDISSVFARAAGSEVFIRISFDDMVTRQHNQVIQDNFSDTDIWCEVRLINQNNRQTIFHQNINLSPVSSQSKNFYSLRTPSANLAEIEIPLGFPVSRQQVEYSISVVKDGKVVDYFLSDGRTSDAEGNCAFVHHGNQGITYTEVFYGSSGGQSGLDGSGFDEVLQAHEATDVPGNFHMSGTLMPAASWHNPEFNDWLTTLAGEGLIEMMTSALGQHIMPFVHNNMNDWSVDIECDMVNFKYNYQPRTAWVPERVWLSPDNYPDAGVIDWLGDNWTQHGVWGIVLDDSPHLNGYDDSKIHWMNNGSGISLRVIPINNTFVGNMHYDADGAKNQIAGTGSYNICVYGTDWEVAAEMNEHDGTYFLDNYESVLWYCHDNYPAVNVWKTVDAMQNANFNGSGADVSTGTYGLLGGPDGYGGSDNSWYTQWASTESLSDFHDSKWTYGYIWDDAHNNLLTAPDNNLSQLSWYILMINLHETGWHDGGTVAGWEHRYSSHIKNANVYAHASRWADGQYQAANAAYFDDIDHDGVDEVVMHNEDIFAVFESIGGKINWLFYKDGLGNAYSVVGSDMAYWSETDGDYNDGSNNHVAALSDVYPNQQNAVYEMNLLQTSGDTVTAEFSQWGVKKTVSLVAGNNFLDVIYDFYGSDGYVKSGFSPGLLDLLWSGKSNVQRMWGDYGSYCGQRNSASGATVALVLGAGGAEHNTQFEGTLVLGDEIKGNDRFFTRLWAGYTSEPTGTTVPELNELASQNMDILPPQLSETAFQIDENTVEIIFDEAVEINSAQNISNYSLENFTNAYTLLSAVRQDDWRKVHLVIQENWVPGDEGQIVVTNIKDLSGNVTSGNNTANFAVPSGTTPHTIVIDGTNDFDEDTELMASENYTLYMTWDSNNLYLGFENMDLNNDGDLFVDIDTDQTAGSGAPTGSWGRVNYASTYRAEYQVAIEGGGGSIQLNEYSDGSWSYPGSNGCNSYEGWSGNGFTEIGIPWASLGNPEGIALAVHVSEEDSQMITDVFPTQNATGNTPTLTHFYALYQPYVAGNMPVSGIEPNTLFELPNEEPEITTYTPAGLSQSAEVGESIDFSVTATDPEDDELTYTWILNEDTLGNAELFTLTALPDMVGVNELVATVNDGIPGHTGSTVNWQVEITNNGTLQASFAADNTQSCLNGTVHFTDQSTGGASQWQWAFEGGDPATSTEQNPSVTYNTAGTFDVSLTVSDGMENNTLTLTDYITVNENPTTYAGPDQESCGYDPVLLSGEADHFSSVLWSTDGDGVFANSSSTITTYTPGPGDVLAGYADLTLTAYPVSPCPEAVSDMMNITILTAPTIVTQPESQVATQGSGVIFEIEAEGSQPLGYTWFGPAGEIPAADDPQLMLSNVTPDDAGDYYCMVENLCGSATSETATLTVENLLTQTIEIPDGWSGISTWLNPQDPMVADIFADMVQANNLIVFQNYSTLYWPSEGINTVDIQGGWDFQAGYQMKVVGDHQITITGNSPASKSLSYDTPGWYLIPVLNSCGVAPDELFADMIDDVVIIKEVAGVRLYWPGIFQNLFTLEPGKSYTASFANAVTFTFPDCDKQSILPHPAADVFDVRMTEMKPSAASHILAFDAGATAGLLPGDVLMLYTDSGFDLAEVTVQKPGNTLALPVFMDDQLSAEKDGFQNGDQLKIAIKRNDVFVETEIETDGNYGSLNMTPNGISLVKSLNYNTTILDDASGIILQFYPNPSKNILYFHGVNEKARVQIFSSAGSLIFDNQIDNSQLDVAPYQPGIYYVYIYQDDMSVVKKFIKQ